MYKGNKGNKGNELPNNLENLFPIIVSGSIHYNLRNNDNDVIIAGRREIFSKSFIPFGTVLNMMYATHRLQTFSK